MKDGNYVKQLKLINKVEVGTRKNDEKCPSPCRFAQTFPVVSSVLTSTFVYRLGCLMRNCLSFNVSVPNHNNAQWFKESIIIIYYIIIIIIKKNNNKYQYNKKNKKI